MAIDCKVSGCRSKKSKSCEDRRALLREEQIEKIEAREGKACRTESCSELGNREREREKRKKNLSQSLNKPRLSSEPLRREPHSEGSEGRERDGEERERLRRETHQFNYYKFSLFVS